MAESYVPTPTNVASYNAVEGGDALTAASVRVWLEALSDYAAWLRENLAGLADNETITGNWTFSGNIILNNNEVSFSPPLSVTRACNGTGHKNTSAAVVAGTLNNTIAPGESCYFTAPPIPDGAVITGFGVRIDPQNDALPTTSARIVLREVTKAGVATDLNSLTDPLTGAAYQAAHDLERTSVSYAASSSATYVIVLVGESGGDEDAYTVLATPWVTFTVTYPLAG